MPETLSKRLGKEGDFQGGSGGQIPALKKCSNRADTGTREEEAVTLFACTRLSLTSAFESLVLPSLCYQTGLFHGAGKTPPLALDSSSPVSKAKVQRSHHKLC